MTRLQQVLAVLAGFAALGTLVPPFALDAAGAPIGIFALWPAALFAVLVPLALIFLRRGLPAIVPAVLALLGGGLVVLVLPLIAIAGPGYWLALIATWLLSWLFAERLAHAIRAGAISGRGFGVLVPLAFGLAVLMLWEAVTRAGRVPAVLLPAPTAIWAQIVASPALLGADFAQTFKAVLAGYALGCGAGFAVAIAIDRSPFLKAGLLPLGNFVSALPLVGIAPIMVMWFGFDWPSKAAVVVIMTFFPMLVNTVAGLNAAGQMERDMMRTYAAGYWQTLFKLRLPAAAPFIFNALKINSTLALIGAIVAEFFGTPIVGMGFRISTSIGTMRVDMVWAEIAVAALAGSAFYGVVALVERAVTFWHPSVRGGRA